MPVGFAGANAAAPAEIKALTFDVFGTVVDWRSSIIREGEALARVKRIKADWAKFADGCFCQSGVAHFDALIWPT